MEGREIEEQEAERNERNGGIEGRKKIQPEVPLWKQVSDCSEKPASSVSPLPEHDREELATLRALLLTCSSRCSLSILTKCYGLIDSQSV